MPASANQGHHETLVRYGYKRVHGGRGGITRYAHPNLNEVDMDGANRIVVRQPGGNHHFIPGNQRGALEAKLAQLHPEASRASGGIHGKVGGNMAAEHPKNWRGWKNKGRGTWHGPKDPNTGEPRVWQKGVSEKRPPMGHEVPFKKPGQKFMSGNPGQCSAVPPSATDGNPKPIKVGIYHRHRDGSMTPATFKGTDDPMPPKSRGDSSPLAGPFPIDRKATTTTGDGLVKRIPQLDPAPKYQKPLGSPGGSKTVTFRSTSGGGPAQAPSAGKGR